MPNFSTLNHRQNTLKVTIPFRGSAGRLHLMIDSTGIKVKGAWSEADRKTIRGSFSQRTRKRGGARRRARRRPWAPD